MLGFAVEDYGTGAQRISRRAVDLLERFLAKGWFDELLVAGRFGVTFLVATSEKATAIESSFVRDMQRRLRPILHRTAGSQASVLADYVVVPGLLSLLPGSKQKSEASQ